MPESRSWSWRYMAPIIPLFALPAAVAYQENALSRKAVWTLFSFSAYLAILSLAPMMWHIQAQLPIRGLVEYKPWIIHP